MNELNDTVLMVFTVSFNLTQPQHFEGIGVLTEVDYYLSEQMCARYCPVCAKKSFSTQHTV